MSRFADPEPASAHNASLVRGRIHADMVSTSAQRRAPREARRSRGSRSSRARTRTSCSTRARPATRSRSICRRRRSSTRSSASGSGAARSCSAPAPAPRAIGSATRSSRARSTCCSRRSAARCRGSTRTPARSRPSGRTRPPPPAADARRRAGARVPARAARRGDGSPAGDPRHRVPGLRAGAPHAAGRDPRRDRGSRGLAARRRGAGPAGRAPQLVAFAIGGAARAEQGRRGLRRRSDARQAQHDVLGVDHGRAELPELRHRPQAQGAAAPRRGRAQAPRRHAALPLRHRPQPRRPHRADDAPEPRVRRARRLGAHRPVRGSGRAGDLLPDPARRVRARSGRSSRTSLRAREAAVGEARDRHVRSRVGPDPAVRGRSGVAARRSRRRACSTARRSTS